MDQVESAEVERQIERLIGALEDRLDVVQLKMRNLPFDHPAQDVYAQLQKDLARYIQEQQHTLSLMRNGMI